MVHIIIKRVYDDFDEGDGFRVLVDRLWPRGVKKEALHYDSWNKDIAPSVELRKWFHEKPEDRWEDFETMYKKQLSGSQEVKEFLSLIKKYETVTLLYASKDKEHNHASILKEYLDSMLSK